MRRGRHSAGHNRMCYSWSIADSLGSCFCQPCWVRSPSTGSGIRPSCCRRHQFVVHCYSFYYCYYYCWRAWPSSCWPRAETALRHSSAASSGMFVPVPAWHYSDVPMPYHGWAHHHYQTRSRLSWSPTWGWFLRSAEIGCPPWLILIISNKYINFWFIIWWKWWNWMEIGKSR